MHKITIKDQSSLNLPDLPGEIWKEIPGYNGKYLISQYSRVKSTANKKAIILRRSISSGKYKVVLVAPNVRLVTEDIGRLCAKVFNRSPAENEVIEYRDGNRLNNAASNLRWISRKESRNKTLLRCRQSNIRINHGEANGRARISEAQAIEIRIHKQKGLTYAEISKMYGISIPTAQCIVENRRWKKA
ncbi:NUMOD4 domain-containing protein [Chryseobacterium sp.]|uniref:NUMOD4 domain-containing protein n=1 Tax=Chryseobacterium sp. TaxID=1871047 RepID=UPI00321AC777